MQLQEFNNSILIIIDHNMQLYVHSPVGKTGKRVVVSECQIKPSSDWIALTTMFLTCPVDAVIHGHDVGFSLFDRLLGAEIN